MYFKDEKIYNDQPTQICYIPEHADGEDDQFTKNDFTEMCEGDQIKAEIIFSLCTWQSPYTVLEEWDEEDDAELQELKDNEVLGG